MKNWEIAYQICKQTIQGPFNGIDHELDISIDRPLSDGEDGNKFYFNALLKQGNWHAHLSCRVVFHEDWVFEIETDDGWQRVDRPEQVLEQVKKQSYAENR